MSSPITQWREAVTEALAKQYSVIPFGALELARADITSATIDLIEGLIGEHETYAQWVLEREEPKGLDKTVVRVEKLRQSLKELKGE